jgi:hypothetical protein
MQPEDDSLLEARADLVEELTKSVARLRQMASEESSVAHLEQTLEAIMSKANTFNFDEDGHDNEFDTLRVVKPVQSRSQTRRKARRNFGIRSLLCGRCKGDPELDSQVLPSHLAPNVGTKPTGNSQKKGRSGKEAEASAKNHAAEGGVPTIKNHSFEQRDDVFDLDDSTPRPRFGAILRVSREKDDEVSALSAEFLPRQATESPSCARPEINRPAILNAIAVGKAFQCLGNPWDIKQECRYPKELRNYQLPFLDLISCQRTPPEEPEWNEEATMDEWADDNGRDLKGHGAHGGHSSMSTGSSFIGTVRVGVDKYAAFPRIEHNDHSSHIQQETVSKSKTEMVIRQSKE